MNRQKELDIHVDSSVITVNLCLGKNFKGGELVFKGHVGDKSSEDFVVEHEPGSALLHLGSHIHGANPITEGERMNLIIWYTKKNEDSFISDVHHSHPNY